MKDDKDLDRIFLFKETLNNIGVLFWFKGVLLCCSLCLSKRLHFLSLVLPIGGFCVCIDKFFFLECDFFPTAFQVSPLNRPFPAWMFSVGTLPLEIIREIKGKDSEHSVR